MIIIRKKSFMESLLWKRLLRAVYAEFMRRFMKSFMKSFMKRFNENIL